MSLRSARRLNTWIDEQQADAIIITGGTGLTGRDVTPEALERIKDKDDSRLRRAVPLGQLRDDRHLDDPVARLAVLGRGVYIFALPGSNGAVKDGWDRILAEQLDSRNRPCNFVELMPRLREV